MKKEIKKRVGWRLRIIEGQIKGLRKMVDEEKYCVNILQQSSAIKNALSSIENLILENHLSIHVAEQMKTGDKKRAVGEMLKIYKLAKRK